MARPSAQANMAAARPPIIQAKNMGAPLTWLTAPAYAPRPKNAAPAKDGYPVNPPIKFQDNARTLYIIITVARRMM